jgi:2,4-dienoyl-CoA reductase-like NADH-dependent reductase (Old Yellow Enzyme family)
VPYLWGWGVSEHNPLESDLAEPARLIALLKARGVTVFNISNGSPYSNPHLSRPTDSPPVDGYQPAWDPLKEVAQHFRLTRAIKGAHPDVTVVGTGYSYLRQFKAHAAEFNIGAGRADFAGLGRAILSYPDEAKQVIETGEAKPGRGNIVCTGDSACTTGPRLGLKSGCIYDPYYVGINQEITKRLTAMGLTKK